MKKMLVLALVLAVAGFANAGLTVVAPAEVKVGQGFQIDLVGAVPAGYGDYGLYGAGIPAINSASKSVKAGNLGNLLYSADFGGYEMSAGDVDDGNANNQPGNGVWFMFMAKSDVVGPLVFELYDYKVSSSAPVETFTVACTPIIPEPMTMALLALGGLFIRRK